jgi:hypothetical protein
MALLKKLQEEAAAKLSAARAAERERQERAEQNRKRLEQFEEDRQLKILQEQRRIEQREVKRLAKLREEQERQHAEKEAIMAKRQQQIAAARAYERSLLEKKRAAAVERDRLRADQMEEFEARQQEERLRYRQGQEEKVRRFAEAKIRLAEQEMERKRAKMTTDAQIADRLRRREGMLELRAENARLQRSDQAVRAIARNEKWKKAQAKKSREMRESEAAKEQHIREVFAEKERERRKQSVQRRLREEEKAETAQRLGRQRELRRDELRERVEASMARVSAIQEERAEVHRQRQDILAQVQREKDRMSTVLEEAMMTSRTDRTSMKRLADMYGVDLATIEQKASVRKAHTRKRAGSEAGDVERTRRRRRGSALSERSEKFLMCAT